ncbi:nucleotide pyrophosphohydrolase [Photobacterium iliopiscarium]|jgi:NTP pyrophosphatase (non-canonical NTP hydrolase)|uniref:Nucleotide pyrophosphohydrolase n=1 Tax=Photobacterium iliopiscarium TaxID=56192 RepID=A0A2T3MR83_9GAMM|nr:nucleotide pyrophosphohydrolase [Photobacterium iliopiscarium]PST95468.1 nucleotide pyrophosphohydrolase [Photobacterium iliopiscarium]PSU00287.1 nucleotide pyrophosphohydrolase [Photobacterium iliopiscarium]PSV84820.1 nucleotide pyrophosphohydrolase [Photobacterium iliopiscarium]PSV99758.1 nucleotide pyrophosphohydrolase [Photobacterium iliopiscarium]PSW99289.1 nucleotide pyrophosphohydrolase [Photobacterium iliopiscarium]
MPTTITVETSANDIKKLQDALAEFAQQRNWDQFHTPKNLVMALSGEVGELIEIFQWLTPEQSQQLPPQKKQHASEEIADVMMYLLRLADKCDIDVMQACQEKIQQNAAKYPISKCYGSAKKYNELD